jgi:uncharacterized protein (DUF2235 family)
MTFEQSQHKNLVICCDGTDNEFGGDNTNVVRLVQSLERDQSQQRLYYQPGIGTLPEPHALAKWTTKAYDLFGSAFGYDIERNVVNAYRFLMDVWTSGDRIYLFGFSRGAYTVRVLAGMLHAVGLLGKGSNEMVPYAMRLFQQLAKKSDANIEQWKTFCEQFRWTFARPMYADDEQRHCNIHFVGAWDTVSSVGFVWKPTHFPFTAANPSVNIIRHAVALDERRAFFRQNLFHRATAKQDLLEIWFPGAHADVGGGYPSLVSTDPEIRSELWRLSFEWIVGEARKAGLVINDSRLSQVLATKQPTRAFWDDPSHDSLTTKWKPAEYVKKPVWNPATKGYERKAGNRTPRHISDDALLHRSVLLRLRSGAVSYSPPNISDAFRSRVRALDDVPETMPYKADPA